WPGRMVRTVGTDPGSTAQGLQSSVTAACSVLLVYSLTIIMPRYAPVVCPGLCPRKRWGARDVLLVLDRFPHPARQAGHVDVADPEVGDGVDDGVDEGGGATHAAALPDALAPDRVVGRGGDDLVQLEVRGLPCGRDHVVHVVGPDAVALGVERDHLVVRHGEGLGETAVQLALDDHRVDPDATVVDTDELEDVPLARLRVDLHRRDVDVERPGRVGRVVVGVVLETRLETVGHVGVGGE